MQNQKLDLSVVVPVYSETDSLSKICDQFKTTVCGSVSYEIIFVNDGNINNDVYRAVEALRLFREVRVIHLSRNFGQHIAIAAGMKNANGKHVLIMDADLQYIPADAFRMYQEAVRQNKSAVISVIKNRSHSLFKRITAKAYYQFMTWLGIPIRQDIGSMFVISSATANGLLTMNDRFRMTLPMVFWLSGDIAYFELDHFERDSGRSGYNFVRLFSLALNGITGFSAKPLYLSIVFACVFAVLALVFGGILIFKTFLLKQTFLAGWLSTILLILVSVSMLLGCLGIIGIYLGKIFEMVNSRPLYFVQESKGNGDDGQDKVKLFEAR